MLARSFDEGGRSGGAVPEMKYSLTFRKGLGLVINARSIVNCDSPDIM
jgi:hypothetical protein